MKATDPKPDTPKVPVPGWAWIFVVVCVAIPLAALGGAIPGALGAGGAGACLAIARNVEKSVQLRVILCSAVSLGAWGGYFTMIMIVVSMSQPAASATSSQPSEGGKSTLEKRKTDLSDEAIRREIFGKATRMIPSLDRAWDDFEEDRAQGRSTKFTERRIEHLEGMMESQQTFAMEWYRITREELDAILSEGDAEDWPYE